MKNLVATVLLASFVVFFMRFALIGESVRFGQLAVYDQLLFIGGVAGAFGFWFMMLIDFFRNTELRHKAIWGFSLFFFSWVASVIYFISCFIPRHKKKSR